MRMTEHVITEAGNEQTSFELSSPVSWDEQLRISVELVKASGSTDFSVQVSMDEIGAGGCMAFTLEELATLQDDAADCEGGAIEGSFTLGDECVDFFWWGDAGITFFTDEGSDTPVEDMLDAAVRAARG